MKAELATGEIVALQKDCDCCTHNDPHWTYMDRVSRNLNRAILYEPDGTLKTSLYAAHGFAIEDKARIDEKLRNMRRLGIVRLIPEASDEPTDEQRALLEENRQWLLSRYTESQPKPIAPMKTDDELRRERNDLRDDVRERAKASL